MSPPTQHFPCVPGCEALSRARLWTLLAWSLWSYLPSGAGAHPAPGTPTPHQRRARGGVGAAHSFACSWLTCLLTPSNGCLGEVLYFLVLLQKALQKPGSFLNRNSEASSKPLLPCVSRNSVSGQPNSDPMGPGGHQAVTSMHGSESTEALERLRESRPGGHPCLF